MAIKQRIKIPLLLFMLALLIRVSFYLAGSVYLPGHFQKFVTADTTFYYDPLALKADSGESGGMSFLSSTRITFLNYLSLFYRYFGYRHWPVSIFHCILGSLAVVLLFLSGRLFLKEKTAFVIGLVAAFQIILVYWTPFVTSETSFIFILALCIFLFSLFIKTGKPIYGLWISICLIIAVISRPLGISFALFMFMYLAWLIFAKIFGTKAEYYSWGIAVLFLVTLIMFLPKISRKIDNLIKEPYPHELLGLSLYLDQMPEVKRDDEHLRVFAARLTMIPGIKIPKMNKGIPNPITVPDILDYFKHHLDKYFILFISRIYTLFNPWVPEYSLKHNIFNLLFYGFIYIFSLMGLIQLWRMERYFAIFILLGIASQILLIGLTIVDYDFRLRLPTEFLLNIPVGVGLAKILIR